MIAYVPGIDVLDPPFHRFFCDLHGFGDHSRKLTRLVKTSIPQFLCEPMILADASRQLSQGRNGNSERLVGFDAEPGHT